MKIYNYKKSAKIFQELHRGCSKSLKLHLRRYTLPKLPVRLAPLPKLIALIINFF
ncbi:hypothetical protein HMPREF9072_01967 [Capnocytophaga sp. oral taxon 324 str. F0483]|nr:hypothetical protein HMPREF9072_01967 [Capnocytophaga sp. oral taxon 324 str. F0483]